LSESEFEAKKTLASKTEFSNEQNNFWKKIGWNWDDYFFGIYYIQELRIDKLKRNCSHWKYVIFGNILRMIKLQKTTQKPSSTNHRYIFL